MSKLIQYGIPNDAVITVAGMVGAGKSTFTNALAEKLKFRTSMEKVDNNPYLENFYHDFKRWSFHLQIFFLAERFKEQKRMFDYGGGFVQDRSIYEDTGIFARMHFDKGNMSDVDYETYTHLFEAMVMTPYFPQPDCLIYLEGSLDDILARIQKRGRKMEQETPVSYWEEMYDRYEKWIASFNSCPVLRVNINDYDLRDNPESIDHIVEKIAQKIEAKREVRL
ncbi:MAG: deoxynucleoside kinase [Bacillota bacterium]|jgi:deoxyadenosine/deoxycytidine kinase|uniref:Deoxycytidine kinase n=2 Tax=Fictibacillus TaxID=1329200 RepID=A0A168VP65_9BACL|nr:MULTISPECIES: deoxynucleoside kinase [Fictibacillus]MBN3552712.1 deoxynucleoside kinase [Fictibacillus nanhaiensis]ANC75355.1 deoxycytidine kinase [Fictibacillus phosphorivorans]MBH0159131.1 deoxynucleoside kinase [Fictibacillus sp. 5RED26]MBH0163262.1 deoxynucleoside kinase [Fictibacillus sp. 26RED30]MBH0171898.1 deoxynucleoside kinase [Fictibacillus sp. 18YEL24]